MLKRIIEGSARNPLFVAMGAAALLVSTTGASMHRPMFLPLGIFLLAEARR